MCKVPVVQNPNKIAWRNESRAEIDFSGEVKSATPVFVLSYPFQCVSSGDDIFVLI